MIMSSFILKTYIKRSFQLSVSILTDILAFFLQHLLKIRMIPSPVKHKQTKTTQQIHSHLKKVHVSRFPVVSNETIQDLNSFAVNKHTQSFDPLNKTVNERTSSEAGAKSRSRHLEKYILKQTAPQELDKVLSIKFYFQVTKRNRDTNGLESL